jgi:hypothetical protein
MAAGCGAVAEDRGAVLGYEQRESHRAGGGKPLPPRRSGRVQVEVERDPVVRGQPGTGRPGKQVVKPGSQLGRVFGGEDGRQFGPGLACVGQVTIVDRHWLGLLVREEHRAQVAGA